MTDYEKRSFLKQFVNTEKSIDELLAYTDNKFVTKKQTPNTNTTDFINTWEQYFEESKTQGSFNTLQKYVVPLQFPVQSGISSTEDYINTTLKGCQKVGKYSLELQQPDQVEFELYDSSIAGKIPVIIVPNDIDFTTIICALANKNEPKKFPNSMGELIINGINNWNRIHAFKVNWLQKHPFDNWREIFKTQVLPNLHLFRDKLIVCN